MLTRVGCQCLTPGITRPLLPLDAHDNCRVAGRVHALVRPPLSGGMKRLSLSPPRSGGSNARHHPPAHNCEFAQANDERHAESGRVHAVVMPRRFGAPALAFTPSLHIAVV